jgi:hypothetical protein
MVRKETIAEFFARGGKVKFGPTKVAKNSKTFIKKAPRAYHGAKQITLRDKMGFGRT